VERELAEKDSLLNVYRELLRERRDSAAIQRGTMRLLEGPDIGDDLLAYCREQGSEIILVVINFGGTPSRLQNPTVCNRVRFVVGLEEPVNLDSISLPPRAGLILSN
jgi:glycosidase